MSEQPEALRLIQHMDDEYPEDWDGTAICDELRRQHDEIEQLKAERDALRKAIRFLFDHGAYLTERVPDHLQAAIDAAREKP